MSGQRGGLLASRMRQTPGAASDRTGPDPTFLEGVASSFRLGRTDLVGDDEQEVINAYGPVLEALGERGYSINRYVLPTRTGNPMNEYQIWQDIAAARARDPKAFAGVAADRDQFRAGVMARYKANIARDEDTSSRSGIVPNLIGGVGASLIDPVNLGLTVLTGGGGAGRTVAQSILREAVLNGALEAAQQPMVAVQRTKTDRTLTPGEAAANVGLGAVAGGVLEGAFIGAKRGIPAVAERTIAGVWDRLPASVRERWASAAELTDDDLPELADMVIGRDNLSEDEAAAAATIRRDIEVDGNMPFVPNGAGIAAHRQRLDAAIGSILATPPRPAPGTRTRLSADTGLASGSVAARPPRETIKSMIGRAESPSDTARNPLSTATGRYQFTRGTFVAYHKRVFGGTMSDAERWGQATNGAVQERLMDQLLADNAAFLKRQGEAETAGNLYLVHFAGQGGAKRLFDADPGVPVERVLGADVVRANPFLRGMSAAEAIAWAHRKMGGPVPARAGGRVELAGGAGEIDVRARLQQEIDEAQAAQAAADADAPAPVDIAAGVGARAEANVADIDPLDTPVVGDAPAAGDGPAAMDPVPVADAPPVRAANDDPVFVDLGDDAVPIVTVRKARKVPRRTRPSDVIEFLTDRGGIRDDEGHGLTKSGSSSRTGRTVTSSRDFGRVYVPGSGKLVSLKNGMSIDEAGELLHEAGFFADRPSTAEVLDMIEQGVANRNTIYALHEADFAAERQRMIEQEEATQAAIDNLPEGFPIDAEKDRDLILDLLSDMAATGDDAITSLARLFDIEMANARQRMYEEADDLDYPPSDPDLESDPLVGSGGAGEGDGGRAADAGTARGSDAPAADQGLSGREPPELTEANAKAFDDPDGEAAAGQIESLEHDARMAVKATVKPDATNETMLSPIFVSPNGPPGYGIEDPFGDGSFVYAVFRDEAGAPKGIVQFPLAARRGDPLEEHDVVVSYVDPAFRRRGVATALYDLLRKEGYDVDAVSGTSDLTPAGAAFVNARRGSIRRSESKLDNGAAVDPAVADRQRQQAQLRAASPMRAKADQESTIGLGLFDQADQERFDLGDGEGGSLKDVFDDLDGEQADIDLLRSCLPPAKPGATE